MPPITKDSQDYNLLRWAFPDHLIFGSKERFPGLKLQFAVA